MTAPSFDTSAVANAAAALAGAAYGQGVEAGAATQAAADKAKFASARSFCFGIDTGFGLNLAVNGGPSQVGMSLQTRLNQLRAVYTTGLGAGTKIFDGGKGAVYVVNALLATDLCRNPKYPRERYPIINIKPDDPAGFKQIQPKMDAAFSRWGICDYQEETDNLLDGSLTVAEYRQRWTDLESVRTSTQCDFIAIINGYSEIEHAAAVKAGGFDAPTLLKGLPIDVMGVDLYNATPAQWELFKTEAGALGLPLRATEWGNKLVTTEADRAAAIVANLEWFSANTIGCAYWENAADAVAGQVGQYVLQGALAAA